MSPNRDIADEMRELLAALREDEITDAQAERLTGLLRADRAARRMYIHYTAITANIRGRINTASPIPAAGFDAYPTSPRITPPLSPLPSPLSSQFVGGPVFSYMVATVVLCLMLLGAWAYKINHDVNLTAKNSRSSTTSGPSELVFVGKITGMKDCRWTNDGKSTILGASVSLNREYALSSGLLEITYQGGARVILEGPCTYKVDSDAGGYLERGKLTARVEAKGSGFGVQGSGIRGQRSEARGQKSHPSSLIPNSPPLSTLHSPLFAVRTPTALVTDLGTEFGVEVKEGQTTAEVFVGSVRLDALLPDGRLHEGRALSAGQIGFVKAGNTSVSVAQTDGSNAFVRSFDAIRDTKESNAYAELVMSLDPAVYYRMERPAESEDALTVVDSAPSGRNGQLHGAGRENDLAGLWCNGRFGGGLRLRGEFFGDYVKAAGIPDCNTNQMSVSLWLLAEGYERWTHILNEGGSHARFRFKLALQDTNGDLHVRAASASGLHTMLREGKSNRLPLGTWQHIVAVADGEMLRLYRNGVEVAAAPCEGVMAVPPRDYLLIGCNDMATDPTRFEPKGFLNGIVDEAAFFNRALSPDEVMKLYKGPSEED